jgi:hypothetical protein
MSTTAAMDKAVSLAEADAGYDEGWCSSTVGNKTKYGAWYGMDCNAWCAMAVSKWYYDAGQPQPASTSKGFAYTPSGASWYQSKNAWSGPSANPERGWVVFFYSASAGRISHVGLVRGPKSGGMVPTVEGNTNGAGSAEGGSVLLKNRDPSQSLSFRIAGYGRPDILEPEKEWWEMPIGQAELDQIGKEVWQQLMAFMSYRPGSLSEGGKALTMSESVHSVWESTGMKAVLANQKLASGQLGQLTDDETKIIEAFQRSLNLAVVRITDVVEENAGQPMTDEQVQDLAHAISQELIESDLPQAFVQAFGEALLAGSSGTQQAATRGLAEEDERRR